MNQETRIQKIQAIINQGNPYWKQDILWQDDLVSFDVYKIPLEFLIYNKYNWRILSRTLSLETQGCSIDVEQEEWKILIEKLLWESKENRNKDTLASLIKIWQEKVWIITKDGIIIDWNRRAMLLNRAGQKFFKAIILPVTLEDDRNSIEEFETRHQMWEDRKLDYNPIEKYLKAWNLTKRWVSTNDIAIWMGETDWKIKQLVEIKELMDEYLEYLEYDWIYTQLMEWQEDLFISLHWWLQNLYWWASLKWFDGYSDNDVDDLKFIAFDYIRIKFGTEDKKFRKLANWHKTSHLFWDKNIWESFSKKHFEWIKVFQDQELFIDKSSNNLEAHLNDRDSKFKENAYVFLENNFNTHLTYIWDRDSKDRPYELTSWALNKISAIDLNKPIDSQALTQLEEIDKLTRKLLGKKSPVILLGDMIDDLNRINFGALGDWKEKVLEKVKEIHHLTYEIKKSLGA